MAAFGELELGTLTDTLVAVAEKSEEFSRSGFGETGGEQKVRLETQSIFGSSGRFYAPDSTFTIKRVTAHPIGHEERAVGVPRETDAHDAFVKDTGVDHFEGRTVALSAESPHFS